MSDQQKIWFVYLTDHHEGPFTPSEVAEKFAQGAVTAQSLGWKDGMAEWLPLETIPELQSVVSAGAAAPAATAATAAGDDGFSLAQMLATQQGGAGVVREDPSITSAGSVLASMAGSVQTGAPAGGLDLGLGQGAGANPPPGEDAWTLKIGAQVSGLHSLHKLKALAAEGEIPPDAMLWHAGWPDFQPLAAVPEVAAARKPRKAGAPQRSGTTGATQRPRGFAPLAAGADIGNDEPTDTGIRAPSSGGIKGILARISGLISKKKAKAPAAAVGKAKTSLSVKSSAGGAVKRIVGVAVALAVVGGGAAYFVLFSSPIPSDLDVIPDDLENMRAVASGSTGQGQLFLALARGTEDDPADDTSPKFYVATTLPEGSSVSLDLVGQPGTLVNRVSFEKTFTATVGKKHLAVFDKISDDGKPLPMGEYVLKVSAEGAEPLTNNRFLGGKKGGAYNDRLKRYKEKLQGEYDKEMQELREYVDTLKTLHAEVAKRLAEFKAMTPATRAKVAYDWKSFAPSAQAMIAQLDQKVRARASGATALYHPRAFQDVNSSLSQMQQLVALHGQRVEGAAPAQNVDEVDGLVQASLISLEQWIAQALVKSPFEVMSAPAAPAGAATHAPTAAPTGTTAAPAPTTAPTAAPAAVPAAKP